MQQQTVTLIVGIFGIVGTLSAGLSIGQYLSRSWQREQWFLDKKIEEYREVLSALTESYLVWRKKHTRTADDIEAMTTSYGKTMQVMFDRITVAREIRKLKIEQRWIEATDYFDEGMDQGEFAKHYGSIAKDIVNLGLLAAERRNPFNDILKRIGKKIEDSCDF